MSTIEVAVAGRGIQVKQGYEKPSAGDVNTCQVSLAIESGGVWDSLPHKRVTFATRTASVTVDYAPTIAIPHEVMASPGALYLTLSGYNADGIEVARTHRMTYPIEVAKAGADEGAEPSPATLDVVSRIDALAADLEEKRDTDYWRGEPGKDGAPGEPGADGYSPTASVTKNGGTATITVTDKNGTTTATVSDGAPGKDGLQGEKGDPFTYADFTEAQILDLQRPATEAAADAQTAIAEVKATEAKLYPAAENILVGSETGAVAHVEDAFAGAALRGITVEGAYRQDGTPSPDNPVPIIVVDNPIFTAAGKNLLSPSKMAKTWVNYVDADGELQVKYGDGRSWEAVPEYGVLPAGTYYVCGDNIEIRRASDNTSIVYNNGNVAMFKLDTATSIKMKVGFTHQDSQYPYVSHAMLLASSRKDISYAPYASVSITFTLPSEHPYLAKLPDGTADEIVVDRDGNVELVARVGRDDNVRNVKYISVGKFYELSVKIPAFANASSQTSDCAICSAIQSLSYNTDGIYRTWTGVYVKDTSGHTKEEIQAEVDKNAPLTVFASIPETRYSLGKIEMPKAQDSIINAWTDAEVTPNTGIEYVRDVNIVISNLESAIASITQG